jgi:hypothetical protein
MPTYKIEVLVDNLWIDFTGRSLEWVQRFSDALKTTPHMITRE